MQSTILAATLLVAGIAALPRHHHQILTHQLEAYGQPTVFAAISDLVANAIVAMAKATPDPLETVGPQTINYASPDGLFSLNCDVDGLRVTGASNLVVNDISISTIIIATNLNFDVVYPQIQFSASHAKCNIVLDGNTISFEGSGTVTLTDIKIIGTAGISLLTRSFTDVKAQLTIGDIKADTVGTLQENDITYDLNQYLNDNLLPFIVSNIDAVNQVLNQALLVFAQGISL